MAGTLAGRVAVVTGGAQGIGQAIAARLAGAGATVVIADIRADLATATAAALVAEGFRAEGLAVDIGSDASVAGFVAEVAARHGRCEILVNNAAIKDATATDALTMERYAQVIEINQNGAVRMVLALLPLMRKGGQGRAIVNVASIMGLRGWPNAVAYSTAKGAVINFTRALAADLAPEGIIVNALAPGFVNTPMSIQADGRHEYDADWFRDIYVKHGRIPMRRWAEPDDIAGPALFLCSDDARYVTGQVLLVDGGASATF